MSSEHCPDSDQSLVDDQRVTREGDHLLALGPILRGYRWVTDHRVGQMRAALLAMRPILYFPRGTRLCSPSMWVYIPALA